MAKQGSKEIFIEFTDKEGLISQGVCMLNDPAGIKPEDIVSISAQGRSFTLEHIPIAEIPINKKCHVEMFASEPDSKKFAVDVSVNTNLKASQKTAHSIRECNQLAMHLEGQLNNQGLNLHNINKVAITSYIKSDFHTLGEVRGLTDVISYITYTDFTSEHFTVTCDILAASPPNIYTISNIIVGAMGLTDFTSDLKYEDFTTEHFHVIG